MIELILSDVARGLEVVRQSGPVLQVMIDPKISLETHLERNQSQLLGGIAWYLTQLYSSPDAPLRTITSRNGSEAVLTSLVHKLLQ